MGILTNSSNNNQKCIDECNRCAQACYECFKACLEEPDIQARKNCLALLVECAQMCQMSAAHMAMDGQFAKEHCGVCAAICEKCAQECSMFNDDHCTECAQICQDCANECKSMAGMQ